MSLAARGNGVGSFVWQWDGIIKYDNPNIPTALATQSYAYWPSAIINNKIFIWERYNVSRHIPLIPIHHQQLNINHTFPSGHNILLQIQKRRILRDRRCREVAYSSLSLRCAIHIDDSTVRSEGLETKTIAFGEYVAYEERVEEEGDLRSGLSWE